MFFVEAQFIADVEILFDCIADRIQTSITRCGDDLALFLMIDRNLSCNSIDLFEMTLVNMEYRFCINVVIRENLIEKIPL